MEIFVHIGILLLILESAGYWRHHNFSFVAHCTIAHLGKKIELNLKKGVDLYIYTWPGHEAKLVHIRTKIRQQAIFHTKGSLSGCCLFSLPLKVQAKSSISIYLYKMFIIKWDKIKAEILFTTSEGFFLYSQRAYHLKHEKFSKAADSSI